MSTLRNAYDTVVRSLRPLEAAELTLSVGGAAWLVLHRVAGMGQWQALIPAALFAAAAGRRLYLLMAARTTREDA